MEDRTSPTDRTERMWTNVSEWERQSHNKNQDLQFDWCWTVFLSLSLSFFFTGMNILTNCIFIIAVMQCQYADDIKSWDCYCCTVYTFRLLHIFVFVHFLRRLPHESRSLQFIHNIRSSHFRFLFISLSFLCSHHLYSLFVQAPHKNSASSFFFNVQSLSSHCHFSLYIFYIIRLIFNGCTCKNLPFNLKFCCQLCEGRGVKRSK